jgi:hypothetical protein
MSLLLFCPFYLFDFFWTDRIPLDPHRETKRRESYLLLNVYTVSTFGMCAALQFIPRINTQKPPNNLFLLSVGFFFHHVIRSREAIDGRRTRSGVKTHTGPVRIGLSGAPDCVIARKISSRHYACWDSPHYVDTFFHFSFSDGWWFKI